jgi:hypothetical protein
MPRAAWKGPFFVAFPGLKQAIQQGTPIATQGKPSFCHSPTTSLILNIENSS